ncbi:MAG: Cys-tRNA(Pro) deacylase [Cocleimonas sp.]|nr:Cys-tRNA(Pro) deacylase [Cocleimonas sp.]
MTPAIKLVKATKIDYQLHSYPHDPQHNAYGEEAAKQLNVIPERVFKTLLLVLNGEEKQLAVAILPVSHSLNLKTYAKQLNVKKVAMANPQLAQNATGYLVGGISPLGQKKRLPMIIDQTAFDHDTLYVSAGKRGLEVELKAQDLVQLTGAIKGKISR